MAIELTATNISVGIGILIVGYVLVTTVLPKFFAKETPAANDAVHGRIDHWRALRGDPVVLQHPEAVKALDGPVREAITAWIDEGAVK